MLLSPGGLRDKRHGGEFRLEPCGANGQQHGSASPSSSELLAASSIGARPIGKTRQLSNLKCDCCNIAFDCQHLFWILLKNIEDGAEACCVQSKQLHQKASCHLLDPEEKPRETFVRGTSRSLCLDRVQPSLAHSTS